MFFNRTKTNAVQRRRAKELAEAEKLLQHYMSVKESADAMLGLYRNRVARLTLEQAQYGQSTNHATSPLPSTYPSKKLTGDEWADLNQGRKGPPNPSFSATEFPAINPVAPVPKCPV